MWLVLVFLFNIVSYSSAIKNDSLNDDFGYYYSRIRILEFTDYSDGKFLKFHVNGPSKVANWSITIVRDSKCINNFIKYHFILQYGAYPLITLHNESFPDDYISKRHDLIETQFNQTTLNGTVEVKNPLQGTWFGIAFVERLSSDNKAKSSSKDCGYYLTTWVNYQILSIPYQFIANQPSQIILSNITFSVYGSYFTSVSDKRLTFISNWSSSCDVLVLIRINGLPSSSEYDYRFVCRNSSCSIKLDPLAALIWIYFQLSYDTSSCSADPLIGSGLIQSSECHSVSDQFCFQSDPLQRMTFNGNYDFLYVLQSSINTTETIIVNNDNNNQSIYSYEFLIDERNIGGTIHLQFQSQFNSSFAFNESPMILICLSKYRARYYEICENDFRITLSKNTSVSRSLPYPEMASWYLTLKFYCNQSQIYCGNISTALTWRLSSSPCTQDQCGNYGYCRLRTSLQNIFSTCSCIAGYRGYGCTDNSQAYLWKYLPSVLLLTLSNLMFLPAVILAIRYGLYIEALVYFFNMFFSTFYHACDQDLHQFCMFQYDGLQLSDFIGSYSSFVITLITMAAVPRSVKTLLFMLGVLTCVAINSRDRFDNVQLIVLLSITSAFTVSTWIMTSVKHRSLRPTKNELLVLFPGFVFAITGLILFAFVATADNYWYVHSLWHILMASAIPFFILHHKKNKTRCTQLDTNIVSAQPTGIINSAAILPLDDI